MSSCRRSTSRPPYRNRRFPADRAHLGVPGGAAGPWIKVVGIIQAYETLLRDHLNLR